jgi:mRNA-degrading endonuclease toxin of MazEF toxin-antitoxin module
MLVEGDLVCWPRNQLLGDSKRRPCVVVSTDAHNRQARTAIVLPLTSDLANQQNLLRVRIPADLANGLDRDSLVMCDQPVSIRQSLLSEPFGRVSLSVLATLRQRVAIPLGLSRTPQLP